MIGIITLASVLMCLETLLQKSSSFFRDFNLMWEHYARGATAWVLLRSHVKSHDQHE